VASEILKSRVTQKLPEGTGNGYGFYGEKGQLKRCPVTDNNHGQRVGDERELMPSH
jgi:hypothetical protein